MGLVYSCGNGFDGALGHDNTYDLVAPQLIEYFSSFSPPALIHQVSAGGDLLGAHSAVVTDDGRIFTWGYGPALGIGSAKSCLTPQIVGDQLSDEKCTQVSCGGGFCVARTANGKLYSWGLWQNGRLGQGDVPRVKASRRRQNRQQNQRFQLRPRLVANLEGIFVNQVS